MKWMELFCKLLSCTEYFYSQVETQLAVQFAAKTGMSLDKFVLVPPDDSSQAIDFDDQGIAHVHTDIVGPDAVGYPVTVAWRCENQAKVRVMPSDPTLEANNCLITAWWETLPVEEIRNQYAQPMTPPWPISSDFPFEPAQFSFEVVWWPFAWPDLWLEVQTTRLASENQMDLLLNQLIQVREQWNEQTRNNLADGLIHNMSSKLKVLASDRFEINIDFGSASPKALVEVLRSIEKITGQLPVYRVICRGYSAS